MKLTQIAALAATLMLLASPAVAQDKKPADKAAEAKKVEIPKDYWKSQKGGQFLAKDRLIGMKVHNKEGQIIGDIEDLIISPEREVVGVIMGVGGFLGVGEKKVGVRYSALKTESKDGKRKITLPSATKEVLTALLPYVRTDAQKTTLEKATEKAKELGDKAKETVKDTAQKVKEGAGPALEKAKDAAQGAVDKAKDLAKPATPATPKP
jgi:sporulation protein YlmC with PRC-barrel domain